MSKLRFDVYGREVVVESTVEGWNVLLVGGDGKSRPAGFPIPADLSAGEILGYLDDLFHESATADNPEVGGFERPLLAVSRLSFRYIWRNLNVSIHRKRPLR
jgi:hypothetical protein